MKKQIFITILLIFSLAIGCKKASQGLVTACFTMDKSSASTSEVVNFSSNCSKLAETYTWDFGDGSSTTGTTAAHFYLIAGTFTVTLKAKGTTGENSATQTITIK